MWRAHARFVLVVAVLSTAQAKAQDYLPFLGSGMSTSDPFKLPTTGDTVSFTNTSGYTEVSCDKVEGETTAVVVTFGQSTANNFVIGEPAYTPTELKNHQYSLLHDKCYRTRGTGLTASSALQWYQARLGDHLIVRGAYQRVILAPLGYSVNTRLLVDGTNPPYAFNRLSVLMRRLIARGIPPTHIVFAIGDGDCAAGIGATEFTANINRVLAALRSFSGTWKYIINRQAFHSGCASETYTPIQAVQAAAVATFGANVVLGANADSWTGATYRDAGDLVHWNQNGAATIAVGTSDVIAANP